MNSEAGAVPSVTCAHPVSDTVTTEVRGVWKCRACGALLDERPSTPAGAEEEVKPTDAEVRQAVKEWAWLIDTIKDYRRLASEEQKLYGIAKRLP